MLNKGNLRASLCDLCKENCRCMLYSLENLSHFAVGSMAEMQVRLLCCLSFILCSLTDLKSLQNIVKNHHKVMVNEVSFSELTYLLV